MPPAAPVGDAPAAPVVEPPAPAPPVLADFELEHAASQQIANDSESRFMHASLMPSGGSGRTVMRYCDR